MPLEPLLLLPTEPISLGGPVISVTQCLILGVTAVVLAGLMYLVNRTKLGRAMRATAENPRVAALMGVKPDMVISATFIIGAALAAGPSRRRVDSWARYWVGRWPMVAAFSCWWRGRSVSRTHRPRSATLRSMRSQRVGFRCPTACRARR